MQVTDRDLARQMARECVAFRVRRASRVVTRAYDHALAPSGLSAVQLTLLSAVENRPDLNQAGLADVLGLEASSLSRALSGLVKQRLLRLSPASDRRERYFEVTAPGRAKLREAFALWRDAQAEVKRSLGAERLDSLIGALDEIAAGPPSRRGHSRPRA